MRSNSSWQLEMNLSDIKQELCCHTRARVHWSSTFFFQAQPKFIKRKLVWWAYLSRDQMGSGLESKWVASNQIEGNFVPNLPCKESLFPNQMKNSKNPLLDTSPLLWNIHRSLSIIFFSSPLKWVAPQEHSSIVVVFITKAPSPAPRFFIHGLDFVLPAHFSPIQACLYIYIH